MSFLPTVQTVQAAVDAAAFGKVINPIISNVVYPVIELLFAIALLVFVYGILTMIFRAEDAEARKNAKISMISGVVGIFLMISAWGIIHLVANTLKGI